MNNNPQEQASKPENPADTTTPHIARVIERVVDFSFQAASNTSELNILELGLSGFSQSKSLARFTKSLTSVDQSDQKIQIASQSQAHDSLFCSELLSFLQTTDKKFDLVFAWDSLNQFDNLEPVIAGIASVMKEHGRAVFGLACPPNESAPNTSNERYHAVSYVNSCLQKESLTATTFQRVAPRLDNAQPVYYFFTHAIKKSTANTDTQTQFHDDVEVDHLSLYQEFVDNNPDAEHAYFQLGNAQLSCGKLEDAIQSLQRFNEKEKNADAFCNIGSAHAQLGDMESAFHSFQSALEVDPGLLPALNNAGRAAHALEDFDTAQNYLKKALDLEPRNPVTHAFLGNIYLQQGGHWNQAKYHLEKSIEINPSQPDIQVQLGDLYRQKNQLDKAMQCFVIASQCQPQNPEIFNRLAANNLDCGRITEAGFCSLKAMQTQPQNSALKSQFINIMLFESSVPNNKIFEESKDWNQNFNRQQTTKLNQFETRRRDSQKRLKLGILSTAFQERLINDCVAPVLNSLCAEKFQSTLYTDGNGTEKLHAVNQQRASIKTSSHLSDIELQKLVVEDEIDILFDMTGHFAKNRLSCIASGAAPVQVNWLGYPATTGLTKPNIIFGDQYTIPPQSQNNYSEQIVRIAACYLCFSPSNTISTAPAPPINRLSPCTFGCFSDARHLSIDVITAWSQVLADSRESKLMLMNQVFENENVKSRILDLFGERDINPSQVAFNAKHERDLSPNDYQAIDIALDPFPCSDPLNALHFLANGVPVVTLAGQRFSSNTTRSVLENSGLQSYVASNWDEYVNIAKGSASEWISGRFSKTDFREQFVNSPVCDIENFTRIFEKICRDAWKKWCEN